MQGTLPHSLGRPLVLAALVAALGAASCQNMNTFVTGERFQRAPEGSQRLEVELIVETHDGVYERLEGTGMLDEAIVEQVLSLADLGLRFYPVLSQDYGKKDARPDYVMIVDVRSLDVETKHETVEPKDEAPYVESWVTALDCLATAEVRKRRDQGPPLVVGQGEGKGRVFVGKGSKARTGQETFGVVKLSEEHADLEVSRRDAMAVIEEAVVDALRELVRPVDRDLSISSGGLPQ